MTTPTHTPVRDGDRLILGGLELDTDDGTVWRVQLHREDCLGEDCDCDRASTCLGQFGQHVNSTPRHLMTDDEYESYLVLGEHYTEFYMESQEFRHPSLTAAERQS